MIHSLYLFIYLFIYLHISGKTGGSALCQLSFIDLIFIMRAPNGTAIIQVRSKNTKVDISFRLFGVGFQVPPQKPKCSIRRSDLYVFCFHDNEDYISTPRYFVVS